MAFNFDGSNNCRVDIAQYYNGTTFDLPANTNAMTITAWFKAVSFGNDQRIIAKSYLNSGTGSTLYCISVVDVSGVKRLRVILRTVGDTTLTGATTTIVPGTIYFVCLWYGADGAATALRSYINCVQEATVAKAGKVAIDSTIPCYIADNPNVRVAVNGIIDDVRVYNRALPISEMQSIYYGQGRDHIVYKLYARWTMNEKNVSARSSLSLQKLVRDVSNNKFNAVSEDAGYCLNFTAANTHRVDLASVNADLQLIAPFTIEAWIKPTSDTGIGKIFGTKASGSNGISFGRNGLHLLLTVQGVSSYETASDRITKNVWQHVAVVFQSGGTSGRSALFYVNGLLVETVTIDFTGDPGTTLSGAQIGCDGTSNEPWNGSIDMVKIYKGEARSADNILLYKDEHPPNSSNLKVYMKFGEASGTSAADVSGNSHTGTLSGVTGTPAWEESGAWATPTYAEPINHRPT